MENNHKIHVDYVNKSFSVEGPVDFVKEYYDILSKKLETKENDRTGSVSAKQVNATATESPNLGHYYSFTDGAVQFHIKKIPGKSKAEQTVNLACLLAFFMLEQGVDTIDSNMLRDHCEDFNCLDKSNFAAHVKSAKNYFVISGTGHNKSLKLNKPGMVYAEELLTSLSN